MAVFFDSRIVTEQIAFDIRAEPAHAGRTGMFNIDIKSWRSLLHPSLQSPYSGCLRH